MSDSTPPEPEATASAAPSAETLKNAYKAFKRRLKLTQLDDASRIGRRPMEGPKVSGTDSAKWFVPRFLR